jgi:hypothetical protein
MKMLRINEYDIEPGVYRHYKNRLYVVLDIITHMENKQKGKMEAIPDPLVVYRDLIPMDGHDVKGKPNKTIHRTYARALSEFNAMVTVSDSIQVRRFTKE